MEFHLWGLDQCFAKGDHGACGSAVVCSDCFSGYTPSCATCSPPNNAPPPFSAEDSKFYTAKRPRSEAAKTKATRMQRNREAAERSREKKKVYVAYLEARNSQLLMEVATLRSKLKLKGTSARFWVEGAPFDPDGWSESVI